MTQMMKPATWPSHSAMRPNSGDPGVNILAQVPAVTASGTLVS
jgi:hypothetical protein